MRFIPKTALATLWLLCMGFLVAPAARAAAKNHSSSDAPSPTGLLVLILLGAGMMFLVVRHGMSSRAKSSGLR
jgi:hypothetical protein